MTYSVALLLGGDSAERQVSFLSGRAVWRALLERGHSVRAFDVCELQTRASQPFSELLEPFEREQLQHVSWAELVQTLGRENFDAAFPILHSGRGEDGTLAALLDVARIPFVGSPMRACAVAMDKAACKAVLSEHGVIVPTGALLGKTGDPFAPESGVKQLLNSACVVKPNNSGSSVGVSIFREAPSEHALDVAVAAAMVDGPALIEELIAGVEVTCPVIGEGENARALPVVEIVPESSGGFYDFEAKYAVGGSRHLIPARVPEMARTLVQFHALQAHVALGCRDVTRSDFIVTPDGKPYFLEINTAPGMTATSLVPDAARAEGVEFPQLVENLLAGAINRR